MRARLPAVYYDTWYGHRAMLLYDSLYPHLAMHEYEPLAG